MSFMQSSLSTASEDYALNRDSYAERIRDLREKRTIAQRGGSEKARQRHVDRGRMLPRHRVEALLDPGTPFLEVGQLAGLGMHEGVPPGGSLITGIGLISGRPMMIIANDSTVKGGTYYGITCKKHVRAQMIAWENRIPCVTLVDSGGGFLPDQPKIFPDDGQFGSIFYNLARMSADGLPQIALILGPCTAGGAYIPAMCDEVVIVRGQGFTYLGGPELTKAATGETIDHIAEDDAHGLAIVREIVRNLGTPPARRRQVAKPLPPKYDPMEIHGIVSRDAKVPTDTTEIIARLVDDSRFHEFKPGYGDTLHTGFARINGFDIGILANKGVLFTESGNKGAHFIDLCCQRDIPLLFLADVTGFMVGREAEESGIAKAGAKMINAVANASVPKYTILIGGSYGAGYFGMCGRPFKPTAMFAWPNGRSAIMGPDQVANTLLQVQHQIRERDGLDPWTEGEDEAFRAPIRQEYEEFADAYNYASNMWIDEVIAPEETRSVMTLLLDCAARLPQQDKRFAVFRM